MRSNLQCIPCVPWWQTVAVSASPMRTALRPRFVSPDMLIAPATYHFGLGG
jgi:hypothetical protein